jgi:hypothetical protein
VCYTPSSETFRIYLNHICVCGDECEVRGMSPIMLYSSTSVVYVKFLCFTPLFTPTNTYYAYHENDLNLLCVL